MDEFTDKIMLYIDDELSEAEATAFEAHMMSCGACQAEFEALTQIDTLFTRAPMVAPPPNFVSRVEVRLEQRLNRRRTIAGVAVMSFILLSMVGLGAWYIAGTASLGSLNTGLLVQMAGFFEPTLGAVATLLKVVPLAFKGLFNLTRLPILWGYVAVSVGMVSLWAQILRRANFVQQPVIA